MDSCCRVSHEVVLLKRSPVTRDGLYTYISPAILTVTCPPPQPHNIVFMSKAATGGECFYREPQSTIDKRLISQAAMKQSLTKGTFIDTKFYAYSRKTSSGSVARPLPLYANSTIIKTSCKYFEGCKPIAFDHKSSTLIVGSPVLAGGYKEGKDRKSVV